MTTRYDCIVLGVGGFGSGALYHLARRGVRVLGLEQFDIAHARGSSHGETRIIRKAYFEHADYVPLLHRAYELWHDLEQETGRTLFHRAGLLIAGPAAGDAVAGTASAARQHQLPLEHLTPQEVQHRFPGFHVPAEFAAVFERDAGFLEVEHCVRTHIEQALHLGAQLHTQERVLDWSSNGSEITVLTDRGRYQAARLVITAGPWTRQLLANLGLPLQVLRKPVFWYPAPENYDISRGHPTFLFEMPQGQFYGFPRWDGSLLKVAEHTGGTVVADPTHVNRDFLPREDAPVAQFLKQCLPDVQFDRPPRHSVCMYTKTPDSHFIIDQHPECPQVIVAAGFSGHGFKFTSVLGEVLADLALRGATSQPIEFLRLNPQRWSRA